MTGVLATVGGCVLTAVAIGLLACGAKMYLRRRWLAEERARHRAEMERLTEWADQLQRYAEERCEQMETHLLLLAQRYDFFWMLVMEGLRVLLDSGALDRGEWRRYLGEQSGYPIGLAAALALCSGEDPACVRESCPYELEQP